jgi:hypothetical protein
MCKLHTNFSHHSILGWWEISFAVLAYIRVFDNGEKPCTFFVVSEKMCTFAVVFLKKRCR